MSNAKRIQKKKVQLQKNKCERPLIYKISINTRELQKALESVEKALSHFKVAANNLKVS